MVDATAITTGADGALWYYTHNPQTFPRGDLGRLTPTGKSTVFDTGDAVPYALTPGPDNAIWFGGGDAIGRVATG